MNETVKELRKLEESVPSGLKNLTGKNYVERVVIKAIKNNIAITGEINLNGDIMAIGGLEQKINGGIRAGINYFLYPTSNHKNFTDWEKKNKEVKPISDSERPIKEILIELSELNNAGLITDEEYQQKRNEILKRI